MGTFRTITLVVGFAASLTVLSACTTYTKDGLGGGFKEVQVGENVWKVSARGNAYASEELISNIILMRSADLAIQNGFKYFAFASSSKSSKIGAVYNPGTTGGFLNFYSKPSAENTVVMFKNKPEKINGVLYDAEFVCKSVGKELKANCRKIK